MGAPAEDAALSAPGSPDFFASLLAHLEQLAPGLPLDRVVLQSVLLCILAGNRHLVLRTRDEDVAPLTNIVSFLLAGPLAYATNRSRLAPAPPHTPESVLGALFLAAKPRARAGSARRGSTAQRSRTYPAPQLAHESQAQLQPEPSDEPSLLARPPLRVLALHAHSDPTSQARVGASDAGSVASASGRMHEMPQALVVSGLEHTSAPCQRALLAVLQDRCIPPEFADGASPASLHLPDNFICVYVCPFDAFERPAIHESLLDRFAMSAHVVLSPATRDAYTSYVASLPSTGTPHSPPLPSPSPSALLPSILTRLQALSTPAHTHLPDPAALFLTRLLSATRAHPELDAPLGVRAARDAEALARALRVLCGGEAVGALVARVAAPDFEFEVDDGDARSGATSVERASARAKQVRVRLEPERASMSILSSPRRSEDGAKAMSDAPDAPRGSEDSAGAGEAGLPAWLDGDVSGWRWDLTEADIGTIAPRVLGHRVRVRAGPEDEVLASVLYHALGPVSKERDVRKGGWQRRTVKEVFVQLFREV